MLFDILLFNIKIKNIVAPYRNCLRDLSLEQEVAMLWKKVHIPRQIQHRLKSLFLLPVLPRLGRAVSGRVYPTPAEPNLAAVVLAPAPALRVFTIGQGGGGGGGQSVHATKPKLDNRMLPSLQDVSLNQIQCTDYSLNTLRSVHPGNRKSRNGSTSC